MILDMFGILNVYGEVLPSSMDVKGLDPIDPISR